MADARLASVVVPKLIPPVGNAGGAEQVGRVRYSCSPSLLLKPETDCRISPGEGVVPAEGHGRGPANGLISPTRVMLTLNGPAKGCWK